MASLWTGLYPARTGVTRYDDVIPDAARMPAEILREAGFQTVGLWRNGWVAPTFGFDQGFDVYQRPTRDAAAAERPARRTRRSTEKGTRPERDRRRRGVPARQRPAALVPLSAPDGPARVHLRRRVGALRLHATRTSTTTRSAGPTARSGSCSRPSPSMGQLENTLIAIASDHGEAFLERGFEGHAREVYRETTEVPFLLLVSLPPRARRRREDAHAERRRLADDPRPAGARAAGGDRRSLPPPGDPGERVGAEPPTTAGGSRSPISTRTGRSATASPCPRSRSWRTAFRYVRMQRAGRDARSSSSSTRGTTRASFAIGLPRSRRRSSG